VLKSLVMITSFFWQHLNLYLRQAASNVKSPLYLQRTLALLGPGSTQPPPPMRWFFTEPAKGCPRRGSPSGLRSLSHTRVPLTSARSVRSEASHGSRHVETRRGFYVESISSASRRLCEEACYEQAAGRRHALLFDGLPSAVQAHACLPWQRRAFRWGRGEFRVRSVKAIPYK
jgi:hypothetical protein